MANRDFGGPGVRDAPREPYDPVRGTRPGGRPGTYPGDGHEPDLRELLSRLGQDATQLAHDELELAKLELRDIADTLSAEVQDAARGLVMDLAKVGIALTVAMLAGLALTAGLVIGVGVLVGAYWAGGIIVGVVLLAVAAAFGMSAAKDLRDRESLRLEETRRTAGANKDVLAREARETKEFARDEAREFKQHATPPEKGHRH